MEEIEFQGAWTSEFDDSSPYKEGSERAEEKGYVMLFSLFTSFSQVGFRMEQRKSISLIFLCLVIE